MQFPLSTSELLTFLPHKPPMVWVDEVIGFSENEMFCKVKLNPEAHYFSSDGIRPSSFIEFMAQGYAFGSIAKNLQEKKGKAVS